MRFNKIIFVLFVLLLNNSCKKEIQEIPSSNNPIFKVSGTIGSDTVYYVAGDDNSVFISSIENYNGINFYKGKLVDEETEIELGLFKGDNDLPNLNLDSILSHINFKFTEFSPEPVFEFNKNWLQNAEYIKEIKWYVNGEYFGTNSLNIMNPGKYDICAQVTYFDYTTTELCNDILVGFKKNSDFSLKYSIIENQLHSWIQAQNTNLASVKWYINNEFVSNNLSLNTQISSPLNKIKAEITFENGSKRTRTILVSGALQNHKSIEDFAAYENENQIFYDYKLKLNIKYKNDEFSSTNCNNENGKFEVKSITFLGNDHYNDPVYLFSGLLNGKVKSKLTNNILDVNLNISWGIKIK